MEVRYLGRWHIPLLYRLEVVVPHPVAEDANGVHGVDRPRVDAASEIVDASE
jgi:hypothetical protein